MDGEVRAMELGLTHQKSHWTKCDNEICYDPSIFWESVAPHRARRPIFIPQTTRLRRCARYYLEGTSATSTVTCEVHNDSLITSAPTLVSSARLSPGLRGSACSSTLTRLWERLPEQWSD
ncbi:hypothetical protein EVAR_98444_1 [Eumeta japonica]|uniref:Uncharacterized protein n=1 Tax=Eumeta variegata TaxID=151549 RepID=A0A4C1YMT0_EUMVA|nr:hypothetical protein EVAR_98444_1 [Eumeta japonica]